MKVADSRPFALKSAVSLAFLAFALVTAAACGTQDAVDGPGDGLGAINDNGNGGLGEDVEVFSYPPACPVNEVCKCKVDLDCKSGVCIFDKDGNGTCALTCKDGNCPVGRICKAVPAPLPGAPTELCLPGEPTPCIVAAELCDGIDNDCNGLTDDTTCDDNNACTKDICAGVSGSCASTPTEGACDDGNACTNGDACGNGVCLPGFPTPCDDSNVCTINSCDPKTGLCVFPIQSGPCNDNSVCTNVDDCVAGTCVGSSKKDCDDQLVCTDDFCDPIKGCEHVFNTAACDDGNACSNSDACKDGVCLAGAATPCDDDNPCTADSCDVTKGACAHVPQLGGCDDSDTCTVQDFCTDGKCGGKPKDCDDSNSCTIDSCAAGACSYKLKPDNTACDDSNACTDKDVCDHDGLCKGEAKFCGDNDPCTTDKCQADGSCAYEKISGAACDDGNLCTLGDACKDGKCESGMAKFCDDGNVCTDDKCDAGGCVFTPNAGPCDDNDGCTLDDKCAGGKCLFSKGQSCNDNNVCTKDDCDTLTGKCKSISVVDGVVCEDGVKCTQSDQCVSGKCVAGVTIKCDDGNLCTSDACDENTGACAFKNTDGAPCTDGNNCTVNDACKSGKCMSGNNNCQCQKNEECAASEDGDACNGTLFCDLTSNTCKVDLMTIVNCDESKNTACVSWKCQAKVGKCLPVNADDNKACDADSSVCTANDHCAAGICSSGGPVSCDDSNACTNDSCDPITGCSHVNNKATCSDGDACTTDDFCGNGKCTPGTPKYCDDGNLCTADLCDKVTGKCVITPISGGDCDDGNPCTLNDLCQNGLCQLGSLKDCDDAVTCTADSCDPVTGKCAFAKLPDGTGCDDGNLCTQNDTCKTGICKSGIVPGCGDNNICTDDSCDVVTGLCQHIPSLAGSPCNDGNGCTLTDSCKNGGCLSGLAKVCEDNLVCSTTSCDPVSGQCAAKAEGGPCDDGMACSLGDTCTGGACVPTNFVTCDDGNLCTNDKCDPKTGKCAYVANSSPCDDKNICNGTFDVCKAGVCNGGPLYNCNDGNVCTTDFCDPTKGCVNTPANEGAACNDGSVCTVGDVCKNGGCKGVGIVCGDGNPCTADSCDVVKGCLYTPFSGPCNDGNNCTLGDICTAGKCIPGAPTVCSDGNACTDDLCQVGTGACVFNGNNANNCSDNNPCTSDDHCALGKCTGGNVMLVCDDKNGCTSDVCDPNNGCLYINNPAAPCTDSNACTIDDACLGGVCTSGLPKLCGDANQCTSDKCDPVKGCVFTPLDNVVCDDVNACTGGDLCKGGACVSGPIVACNDSNVCTNDSCDNKLGCIYAPIAGQASVSITAFSDATTTASATQKLTNGLPTYDVSGAQVFLNYAQAAPTAVASFWTATIPGATWIWYEAVVSKPTLKQEPVGFTRTFDLPIGAGSYDGKLAIAADAAVACWVNGIPAFPGTLIAAYTVPKTVTLKKMVKGGTNTLQCTVTNYGEINSTALTNPAGLLYRLDAQYYAPGTLCDDGNACTLDEVCQGGTCKSPGGTPCDDNNACTTDACDPITGCTHKNADGIACEDGNLCTAKDSCKQGKCFAGGQAVCDDSNICTTDSCDGFFGCSFLPSFSAKPTLFNFISDKTTTYKAADNSQKPAVPTYDQTPGWNHTLAPAQWIWSAAFVETPDQTQAVTFTKVFTLPKNSSQMIGSISLSSDGAFLCALGGKLVGVNVNEANFAVPYKLDLTALLKEGDNTLVCTVTNPGKPGASAYDNPAGLYFSIDVSWYPVGGTTPCNDGNACTNGDWCDKFVCASGAPLSCDDNNACTADACDPKTGCSHVTNGVLVCDDGNPCTVSDVCKNTACVGGALAACVDGNPCTTDACNVLSGCTFANADGLACDDGDLCTGKDTCAGGTCKPLAAAPCDDGNPCTNDSCAPKTGCFYNIANNVPCDDGNTCTADDLCAGGICLGKGQAKCDDSNECTNDGCTPVGGCTHALLTGNKCEDGDLCTFGDVCAKGACATGSAKNCADGEACTIDSCDSKTGACIFTAVLAGKCEDGNLCTINDICDLGKCVAGAPRDCNDGNSCTTDSCDAVSGDCVHLQAIGGYACNDGDLCTLGDACKNGICVGTPKPCDDGNGCTADSCDPNVGKCVNASLADGTVCGAGTCSKGICK